MSDCRRNRVVSFLYSMAKPRTYLANLMSLTFIFFRTGGCRVPVLAFFCTVGTCYGQQLALLAYQRFSQLTLCGETAYGHLLAPFRGAPHLSPGVPVIFYFKEITRQPHDTAGLVGALYFGFNFTTHHKHVPGSG